MRREGEIRKVYSHFNVEAEFFYPDFEQDIIHRLRSVDSSVLGIVFNPEALHTFEEEIIMQLRELHLPLVGIYMNISSKNGEVEKKFHMLNPPPVILFGCKEVSYHMALVAILEISYRVKDVRKRNERIN
jgi:3-dehydroquinate dehydratase